MSQNDIENIQALLSHDDIQMVKHGLALLDSLVTTEED